MGPKEVPEESVPERDRRGVISTNVALVALMCVQGDGLFFLDFTCRLLVK